MSFLTPNDFNQQFDVTHGLSAAHASTSMCTIEARPSAAIDPASPLEKGDVVEIVNEGGQPRASRLTYVDPAFDAGAAYNQAAVNTVLDAVYRSIYTRKDALFVLEGYKEGESGYLRNNLTLIHGHGIVSTQLFTAGAYVPGAKVTVVSGRPKLQGSDVLPAIGEVHYYNSTQQVLEIRI